MVLIIMCKVNKNVIKLIKNNVIKMFENVDNSKQVLK